MLTIKLSKEETESLLSFLETLIMPGPNELKSTLLRKTVVELMENIKKQTHVELEPHNLPAQPTFVCISPPHVTGSNGVCMVCGAKP